MPRIGRPTGAPLLAALVLLAPALAGCVQGDDPSAAAPEPSRATGSWALDPGPSRVAVLGDPDTSGLPDWPGTFDSTPTVHDLDGDGAREVIAQSSDRNVYVFDPTDGRALAVIETTYPPSWHTDRILNHVEAAQLAPGQPPSIVVANHAAHVSRWQVDPDRTTGDELAFDEVFERRMDTCEDSSSMDGGPALADLDADGELEILVQTEEVGLYALDTDGSTLWHQCWAGGNAAPTVGDLDADGEPEAVFASDAGLLVVLDGATGEAEWTVDASAHGIEPASVSQSPTIAEVDGQPPREVLFTARDASITDPDRYDENAMAILAVHQNATTGQGEVLWMRQPSWANPMSDTRLVVTDVDDDGRADVLGMDWNTIGHRPGQWERLGPANVFRLNATGGDVWVRQLDTWWSNQDVAVRDVDADGQAEVLAPGPGQDGDGIRLLSADTGAPEGFLPVSPWKTSRGAHLADLGDGRGTHLLAPVQADEPKLDRGAILVYDLGLPPDSAPATMHR